MSANCHDARADHIQMGLEFRDSAYLLSPKNSRHLKENMVLNLALGFADLQDENGETCVLCHRIWEEVLIAT